MSRYVALIDGERGAYGVAFPDCPGCTAMGETIDEALHNAAEALSEWVADESAAGRGAPAPRSADELRADPEVVEAIREGAAMAVVPLVLETGRATRANVSIDAGLLAAIDEAAARAGITRSAYLASAARERLVAGE
ncbi:type II toxin-antitoxin system HicB family antitoxin [Kaustia mangrovi]|uniref:Type II toxin-antitoxin system HicB family antitoxin n=1 Tax=Kaustia mangrovi TaxID=2593653 RepID=A0A7S8HCP2_9HYPH|nr:type II toxin-antitoxin system HicB family antitoxin [Kaustia mangrovi]QPC43468.1 type II toxin-antitoxin system HicB family antitoxin [Kaustia mangrovi]